jgi:hypothetical protein
MKQPEHLSSTPEIQTKQYTPEQQEFDPTLPTIVVCPGWAESWKVMEVLCKIFAQMGYQAISYSHNRSNPTGKAPIEIRQATLEQVIARYQLQKVVLVASSQAGLEASSLAFEKQSAAESPFTIEHLFLVDSAGLIKNFSRRELLWGFIGPNTVQNLLEVIKNRGEGIQQLSRYIVDFITYVAPNWHLALQEIKEMASLIILEQLQQLQDVTVIVHAKKDKVFPFDKVDSSLAEAGLQDKLIMTDGPAHNGIWINLKGARSIAELVQEVLNQKFAQSTSELPQ